MRREQNSERLRLLQFYQPDQLHHQQRILLEPRWSNPYLNTTLDLHTIAESIEYE